MTLLVGQVLQNRYRVDALVSQGGLGAVYHATDLSLGYAAVLKESLSTEPDVLLSFTSEARVLASLAHPNLPRVIDYFSIPGQGLYLVQEAVEGQGLEQMLAQRGRLEESEALAYIVPVLNALEYLHSRVPPLLHLGVNPAAIRVAPKGRVYLMDLVPALPAHAALPAPAYAPPEQLGPGGSDTRTDLFSVGATLYALLTGQAPPPAWELAMGSASLVPLRQVSPSVSPWVEAAVLRAMQLRPADRVQSAGELRAALLRQAEPAAAAVGHAVCPRCGAIVRLGSAFCYSCGYQLPGASAGPMPAAPPGYGVAPAPAPWAPAGVQPEYGAAPAPAWPAPFAPPPSPGVRPAGSVPMPAQPSARPAASPRAHPRPSTGAVARSTEGAEISTHGRTEYYSPMLLNTPYPLRVGFLPRRHAGRLLPGSARVHWSDVRFQAAEPEPTLTITASSLYFRISPARQAVTLRSEQDVFVDFQIMADQVSPGGVCDITIQFEYRGSIVKTFSIPVRIQRSLRLGSLPIPAPVWPAFLAAGAVLNVGATLFQVYDFSAQVFHSPTYLLWFLLSLAAGTGILVLGALLRTKVPRRRARMLR